MMPGFLNSGYAAPPASPVKNRSSKKGKRGITKQKTSDKVKQYLMFAGPGTILFFCVVVVPFVYGLYLTFTSWDGVSRAKPFVGFRTLP